MGGCWYFVIFLPQASSLVMNYLNGAEFENLFSICAFSLCFNDCLFVGVFYQKYFHVLSWIRKNNYKHANVTHTRTLGCDDGSMPRITAYRPKDLWFECLT